MVSVMEDGVMDDKVNTFAMPGGSWESIKKIVRAYGAARDEEKPTVESIAGLAGLHRPVISKNNNFLRAVGILRADNNKLTPVGEQLATGIALENEPLVTESLRQIIGETRVLARLVGVMEARGQVKLDAFKAQVILLAGLNESSTNLAYIRALVDMLVEAAVVKVEGDTLSLHSAMSRKPPEELERAKSGEKERKAEESDGTPTHIADHRGAPGVLRTPIALSPDRLAYIELPADWNGKKELAKLLKLLQLSLGDEVEG